MASSKSSSTSGHLWLPCSCQGSSYPTLPPHPEPFASSILPSVTDSGFKTPPWARLAVHQGSEFVAFSTLLQFCEHLSYCSMCVCVHRCMWKLYPGRCF